MLPLLALSGIMGIWEAVPQRRQAPRTAKVLVGRRRKKVCEGALSFELPHRTRPVPGRWDDINVRCAVDLPFWSTNLFVLWIFIPILHPLLTLLGYVLSLVQLSAMSLLRSLYSLDTLDKRFTTPSRAPIVTKEEPDPAKPRTLSEVPDGASPSLWKTSEFFSYYLVIGVSVPLMIKTGYDISQRECLRGPQRTNILIIMQLSLLIIRTSKISFLQVGYLVGGLTTPTPNTLPFERTFHT